MQSECKQWSGQAIEIKTQFIASPEKLKQVKTGVKLVQAGARTGHRNKNTIYSQSREAKAGKSSSQDRP